MLKYAAFLFSMLFASAAFAQAQPPPPSPPPTAIVCGSIQLAIDTNGENQALPCAVPFNIVTIYNEGTVDAFYALGNSSVTATTSSKVVPAGTAVVDYAGPNTYIAGITGSSSSTLNVWSANGPINFANAEGGGGGGGGCGSGCVTTFNGRSGAVTLQPTDVSGATGLLSTNNLSDVQSPSTALANLGGGTGNGSVTSVGLGLGLKSGAGGTCSSSSAITTSGSIYPCFPIITKTGTYNVLTTDLPAQFVMNCSSSCTLTMPQADVNGNYQAVVQSTGTGTVSVGASGGSTIYGAATSLTQYGWDYLGSDGTNYAGQSNQLGTTATVAFANPSATAGPTAVNGSASTAMRSDAAPAVQKASNSQFGLAEGDGTSLSCPSGVCSVQFANPTGTAGPTAVNGSATTAMRSDAAPAVQLGTNAQKGIIEGDGSTLTCVSGICSAIGGAATSLAPGTTTVSPCTNGYHLTNNAGVLACTIPPVTSGTANQFSYYASSGSVVQGDANLTDNGTVIAAGEPFDVKTNPVLTEIVNSSSTGTTVNELAKLNSSGQLVVLATTDTIFQGVIVGGAGTSGSAQVAINGQASCVFDGSTTAGDWVIPSTSIGGECHDTGSATAPNQQAVGRVLSTNGSGGTYLTTVQPQTSSSSGGGGGFIGSRCTALPSTTTSGHCIAIGNIAFSSGASATVYVIASKTITLTNFYVSLAAAITSGQYVATLYVNGSSTAITCTVTSQTCHDTSHSVTLNPGDLYDILIASTTPSAGSTGYFGFGS